MTVKIEALAPVQIDAINLVKKFGSWQSAGPVKLLVFARDHLQIAYRTPFQKLPEESEKMRYKRTALGGKPKLPYGLDVWYSGKKVMNIEWDDKGNRDVVTYRPGVWEAEIRRYFEAD
jgi:hypothetical protein